MTDLSGSMVYLLPIIFLSRSGLFSPVLDGAYNGYPNLLFLVVHETPLCDGLASYILFLVMLLLEETGLFLVCMMLI